MPNASVGIESRFDAVIFDFDGVIVESTDIKTEAFRALFADYPDHVEAIVALHRRQEGVNRTIKIGMIYRDILRRPLDAVTHTALADRFGELVLEQVVACPAVAGAQQALGELSRHIPLAIISSTPDGELQQIVERRGLARYFRVVRGAPLDKAAAIRDVLAAFQWSADRVAMVGDTTADLEAARDNELQFIGRVVPGRVCPFSVGIPVIDDLTTLTEELMRLSDTGR
jgi:phosphoglycolate phosphatase-like HAD superfamily hydrolase